MPALPRLHSTVYPLLCLVFQCFGNRRAIQGNLPFDSVLEVVVGEVPPAFPGPMLISLKYPRPLVLQVLNKQPVQTR